MGLFKKNGNNKLEEKKLSIDECFALNLKYISDNNKVASDIEKQFVKTNTRFYLTVGNIDCPTGKIVVGDPLAYLYTGMFCSILDISIPPGEYPVEISICRSNDIGIRVCTVRLKIKNTKATVYEVANSTIDGAAFKSKDGIVSGFLVDAGMVSICDLKVSEEYGAFLDDWYKKNPNGNHYDDYFADFFKESEKKYPQFQREDGDFIEWANPNTGNRLVMIASGMGDGFYQSYFGYDANNDICELIIPLVNPDLFGV